MGEKTSDLNRYEHAEKVDEAKIQSARTRVITYKQLENCPERGHRVKGEGW